jgi:hypothetical protein
MMYGRMTKTHSFLYTYTIKKRDRKVTGNQDHLLDHPVSLLAAQIGIWLIYFINCHQCLFTYFLCFQLWPLILLASAAHQG